MEDAELWATEAGEAVEKVLKEHGIEVFVLVGDGGGGDAVVFGAGHPSRLVACLAGGIRAYAGIHQLVTEAMGMATSETLREAKEARLH